MLTEKISTLKKKDQKILLRQLNADLSTPDQGDSWNPAEISQRSKQITYISKLVDSWNPAQINEALQLLDLPIVSTWNPAQLDEQRRMLKSYLVEKTVTGNPLQIKIPGNLTPEVTGLTVAITPSQSGSGTPSPTNVRPISGWTEEVVTNLADSSYIPYFEGVQKGTHGFVDLGSLAWEITTSGTYNRFYTNSPISAIKMPSSQKVISNIIVPNYITYSFTNVQLNDKGIGLNTNGVISITDSSYSNVTTFRSAMSGVYLIYELATATTPSYTDAEYETLVTVFGGSTTTLPFSQTVYGGTVDVLTGVLTITKANIASYDGETINEPWISSMDEYVSGATPTAGAQVVYTLSTPTTVQLTGAQVDLIKGINNLSANTGDITITYKQNF